MADSHPLADGQTSQRIVCPFCPLHCDDIEVVRSANQSIGIRAECRACQSPFDAALHPAPARIQNRSVTFGAVTQHFAGRWLHNRNVFGGSPTVIATVTDLQSARQLSQLHTQGLIQLRMETSPTLAALRMAIRRDGVVAATLGDVRRHADLMCTIGDVERWAPRMMQRLAVADGVDDPTTRRIELPEGISADQAARLSRLLINDEDAAVGSDDDSRVTRLARSIRSASYVAVIFAPDAFREDEAIAAAAMLNRLVMQLNRRRRAVLLQLDPAATLRSVFAWQTNESIDEVSREAAGNLSVRIGNAFDEQNPLPVDIQIGGIDPGQDHAAAYVPAATVGIHRQGMVVRGDGSVTLPLDQIEQSDRLPAAEWLAKVIPRQFG